MEFKAGQWNVGGYSYSCRELIFFRLYGKVVTLFLSRPAIQFWEHNALPGLLSFKLVLCIAILGEDTRS